MDPALDREKIGELLDLTGGEAAWLRDLLDTYLRDTRARLTELAALVGAGSAERIQRAAHGIKGSSANIGANRMADLCARMESLARAGDTSGAQAHVAALEAEFARIAADVPAALRGGR